MSLETIAAAAATTAETEITEIQSVNPPKNNVIRGSFGTSESAVEQIELDLIDLSPTNPRRKINIESLEELATNIRKNGVIQNIVVRPKAEGRFEIVSGERRYRASLMAERKTIPARIANLSDAQVIEIQISENLHREDVHPLEEAAGYQYLLETVKAGNRRLTMAELAVRVGKNINYVHTRLQLTKLIEAAKESLLSDKITLSHALELAKYSEEIQVEALEQCFEEQRDWDETAEDYVTVTETAPVAHLRSFLNRSVLQRLQDAPFDVRDKRLHPEGRICPLCPYRSGNAPSLFENLDDADICTNKPCFQMKTRNHIALVQIEARAATAARTKEIALQVRPLNAEAADEDAGDESDNQTVQSENQADNLPEVFEQFENHVANEEYRAPLVRSSYYSDNGMIGSGQYVSLGKEADFCPFAESAVFGDGAEIGNKLWICRVKLCAKHFRQSPIVGQYINYAAIGASAAMTSAPAVDNKEQAAKRRQELFDMRVAEPVRVRVLKESAANFNETRWIWNDEFYLNLLISRLFKLLSREEGKNLKTIGEILDVDFAEFTSGYESRSDKTIWTRAEKFGTLSAEQKSKLLYLMLICSLGENPYLGGYVSQETVIELAKKENLNYLLFDAEERLCQAAKKYKAEAKAYLKQVQMNDETAAKPLFWQKDLADRQAHVLPNASRVLSADDEHENIIERDDEPDDNAGGAREEERDNHAEAVNGRRQAA